MIHVCTHKYDGVYTGRGFGAFGHNKVASASKYDGVYVIHGMWKRNANLFI